MACYLKIPYKIKVIRFLKFFSLAFIEKHVTHRLVSSSCQFNKNPWVFFWHRFLPSRVTLSLQTRILNFKKNQKTFHASRMRVNSQETGLLKNLNDLPVRSEERIGQHPHLSWVYWNSFQGGKCSCRSVLFLNSFQRFYYQYFPLFFFFFWCDLKIKFRVNEK